MSINTEIARILNNISNAYTALAEMGATMPELQNSENLASTIMTIPRIVAQAEPPEDTKVLWIDTDDNNYDD